MGNAYNKKEELIIYKRYIKPLLDYLMALTLLLLLSPLFLLISLLLAIHYLGNPFFVQRRVGRKGKEFSLIKFRSFACEGDHKSITWIGAFIRKSSLDELPQLINILSGQMSFVGPRPLLPEYIPYYTQEENARHQVKPGLTGLSQLRFGNSNEWDKRMKADVEYVHKQSLFLDCRILVLTLLDTVHLKKKARKDVEIEKFSDFAARR